MIASAPEDPGHALRAPAPSMLAAPFRWLLAVFVLLAMAATAASAQNGTIVEGTGLESLEASRGEGPAPPPVFTILPGPGGVLENILIGPQGDQARVRQLVAEFGGEVLRETALPNLGQFTMIAAFAAQAERGRFATALGQQLPQTGLSVHWNYRFAQAAPRIYAHALIGDPAPGGCRLARPVRIGMIDGPVNAAHPSLRGARLRQESLVSGRVPAAHHGTAVAALLVGEDPAGALAGYARGAELFAVAVFRQTDGGAETSGELIARALDRLVGHRVQVINMSLAGPDSNALRRAISATAARGVVMVGASGNDRAPRVGFPAAAPEVVAVTAVDAAQRRFRLANIGAETEFAAPGVDVYAARATGAGYVSGTSFAAPIVTALIAREIARGITGERTLRTRLRAGAQALGGVARSPEFGWGLVRALSC